MCRPSSSSAEADPGLIGQGRDPLGPQHRRELAKHAWQTPGRYDRYTLYDDRAPGDLGAVDAHVRHHRYARVGQDHGGLVGLERDGLESGGEGEAAEPQPPGRIELKAAAILLGVDHEHPTGPDRQMVDIRLAPWDGQVMED